MWFWRDFYFWNFRKIQRCISKEEIDTAFYIIDVDGNGAFSRKELSEAATKSGYNITEKQVEVEAGDK